MTCANSERKRQDYFWPAQLLRVGGGIRPPRLAVEAATRLSLALPSLSGGFDVDNSGSVDVHGRHINPGRIGVDG